jgi:RHS repeat-associated protein
VGTIDETDFGYTSQRANTYIKLYDYRSRWYDPLIGRFTQPDPIIPSLYNPQSLNRYSYVYNRPIILNDPTGHLGQNGNICTDDGYCGTTTEEYFGGMDESGDDKEESDVIKRLKSGSDYISLNVVIPLLYGVIGPNAIIIRDRYNNWYWGIGVGISPGFSADLGFGWLLRNETPSEDDLENFVLKHSVYGSGGYVLGVGFVHGDPAVGHLLENPNYESSMENGALEVEITSPGFAVGYTYRFWIYDNGDPTPWFWQDRDGINH